MNLRLETITRQNFDAVIALELAPHQLGNLPANVYSIAESTLSPLFQPRAIMVDKQVVGFLMYQFGEIGEFDESECTLWRFMIDRHRQSQGIGSLALQQVLEEISGCPRCQLVDVYYLPGNLPAKRLYARHGFRENGERDDGTVIAEKPLST